MNLTMMMLPTHWTFEGYHYHDIHQEAGNHGESPHPQGCHLSSEITRQECAVHLHF